jgi:hypothetical protein
MAPLRAGTPAVDAHSAAKRTATPSEPGDEPDRRSGYRSSCGSNFWIGFMPGEPFRTTLRKLRLTSNQVWGLTKTDDEWSAALEAALTATRRQDLKHGTNAAYVRGCVCSDCRQHQRIRMARQSI